MARLLEEHIGILTLKIPLLEIRLSIVLTLPIQEWVIMRSIMNSTLIDTIVANSTINNSTVMNSMISDVASLSEITLSGVTVTGDPNYDFEGKISAGTGWATYRSINFTKIYADVRISQLVIERTDNIYIPANRSTAINDSSLGTSMNFSMTVNLVRAIFINISETGINPEGAGISSGILIGNFLHILNNDPNSANVINHTLRMYFDTDPSTYSGGVAIYYYNTSATPGWEALATTRSGTENGRYFREAAPNHFSTFALVE